MANCQKNKYKEQTKCCHVPVFYTFFKMLYIFRSPILQCVRLNIHSLLSSFVCSLSVQCCCSNYHIFFLHLLLLHKIFRVHPSVIKSNFQSKTSWRSGITFTLHNVTYKLDLCLRI